jgi:Protein of unknown function (DUF6044)
MPNTKTHYKLLGLCTLIASIVFIPLMGPNGLIRIQDNLDSYYVYYEILANNPTLGFGSAQAPVEQVMGGLPRGAMPSPYNVTYFCFLIFGGQWGYVFNALIVHIIGFIGIFSLLGFWYKEKGDLTMKYLISLCFATLPIFSIWGLSLLGQPLLLLAFLYLITQRNTLQAFAIILLFPLFSQFVLAGFFIIIVTGLLLISHAIYSKKIQTNAWLALFGLAVSYIIVDHRLFELMYFTPEFIGHRDHSFDPTLNFKGVIGTTVLTMLNGWYHSSAISGFLMLPITFIGIFIAWRKRQFPAFLIGASLLWFSMAFICALLDWKGLEPVFDSVPVLKSFSFKRFHFLLPFFAFLAVAFSLQEINKYTSKKIWSYAFLCALLFSHLMMHHNFNRDGMNNDLFKTQELQHETHQLSEYFSPGIFELSQYRKSHILQSQRFVCLGLSPAQVQHFGIPTLDSYQNLYSKSHKDLFCEINEQEYLKVGKTCDITNKCQLYSRDAIAKDTIQDLKINFELLLNEQTPWIISSKPIASPNVALMKEFSNSIFLYQILSSSW